MSARLFIGDVHEVLATLPENSVDLVVTSPPFLALRSYLPADHPQKSKEIGSEPTPGAFLDTLLDLTEEWARVLAPHGSICVELGDTYSGSGGAGGDYGADGLRAGAPAFTGSKRQGNQRNDKVAMAAQGIIGTTSGERAKENPGAWPDAKSLTLIPELYRFALAYGFNPLTGRQTPTWRVRNVVRWHRPNPPVGALGDKFRPATSDMVVACKSRTRYFDLDAVRSPFVGINAESQSGGYNNSARKQEKSTEAHGRARYREGVQPYGNPAGAPPLDTWIIPTAPYKGSHYATFPPDLVVRPIKAMCPERVCVVCGEPSRRVVENSPEYQAFRDKQNADYAAGDMSKVGVREASGSPGGWDNISQNINGADRVTIGWTDCGHDDWRPGVVLDPFAGSGTTLAVATGHGRDAIGIDIDERNADLCRERIGMFLEIVEQTKAVPA